MEKNYDFVCRELRALTEKKMVYDQLHEIGGIPYKLVHYIDSYEFNIDSGYSMGEIIFFYVGNKVALTYDHRKEYSGGSRYKASHGSIYIMFSKRDFRLLFGMIKEYVDFKNSFKELKDIEKRNAAYRSMFAKRDEISKFVKEHIDYEESIYKNHNSKNVYCG